MDQGSRLFLRDGGFPLSMRVLFTGTIAVLGIGYLFAVLHMFNTHAGRDGSPGLSIRDIVIAYSGSKEDTQLEAALKGPMSGMLAPNEKNLIVSWIRRGTNKQEFEEQVLPVFEQRCISCHDGSNPHIARMRDYDDVVAFAELDTGMDIFTLVRVSHIHLFGITFIFFVVGYIFSYAYIRPAWFKAVVIAIPFVGILLDVGSWYLTKIFEPFAWVVVGGGALMGACFAYMCLASLYQMWIPRLRREFPRRSTGTT